MDTGSKAALGSRLSALGRGVVLRATSLLAPAERSAPFTESREPRAESRERERSDHETVARPGVDRRDRRGARLRGVGTGRATPGSVPADLLAGGGHVHAAL